MVNQEQTCKENTITTSLLLSIFFVQEVLSYNEIIAICRHGGTDGIVCETNYYLWTWSLCSV